jgi:hypothetical protein
MGAFNTDVNARPSGQLTTTWNDSNITEVTTVGDWGVSSGAGGRYGYQGFKRSFLFTRPVTTATIDADISLGSGWSQQQFIYFSGYEIESAGSFAVKRQMLIEEQLRSLRGMTTDIDLSRPTQD